MCEMSLNIASLLIYLTYRTSYAHKSKLYQNTGQISFEQLIQIFLSQILTKHQNNISLRYTLLPRNVGVFYPLFPLSDHCFGHR